MNLKYDTFSTVSTTLSNIQTEINNLETLKGQINSLETDISEISGALQSAKKAVISAIDSVIDEMTPAIQKVNDAIADLQAYEAKAANSDVLNKELKVKEVAPATSTTTTMDTTQNSLTEPLKPISQTTSPENVFVGIGVTETKQQTSTNSNYTIKSGDTLSEIAKANNVTVEELMAANKDITNPNLILAGASIIIPGNSASNNNEDITKNVKNTTQENNADNSKKSEQTQSDNKTNTNNTNEKTKKLSGIRVTSYYPAETSNVTGSGKTTNDFKTININGKNVYTYDGKIVVATATEELLRTGEVTDYKGNIRQDGKHYFSYYDEFKIKIDGNEYDAIVLDSCGASMWEGQHRIDFFVPSSSDVIDTTNVEIIV